MSSSNRCSSTLTEILGTDQAKQLREMSKPTMIETTQSHELPGQIHNHTQQQHKNNNNNNLNPMKRQRQPTGQENGHHPHNTNSLNIDAGYGNSGSENQSMSGGSSKKLRIIDEDNDISDLANDDLLTGGLLDDIDTSNINGVSKLDTTALNGILESTEHNNNNCVDSSRQETNPTSQGNQQEYSHNKNYNNNNNSSNTNNNNNNNSYQNHENINKNQNPHQIPPQYNNYPPAYHNGHYHHPPGQNNQNNNQYYNNMMPVNRNLQQPNGNTHQVRGQQPQHNGHMQNGYHNNTMRPNVPYYQQNSQQPPQQHQPSLNHMTSNPNNVNSVNPNQPPNSNIQQQQHQPLNYPVPPNMMAQNNNGQLTMQNGNCNNQTLQSQVSAASSPSLTETAYNNNGPQSNVDSGIGSVLSHHPNTPNNGTVVSSMQNGQCSQQPPQNGQSQQQQQPPQNGSNAANNSNGPQQNINQVPNSPNYNHVPSPQMSNMQANINNQTALNSMRMGNGVIHPPRIAGMGPVTPNGYSNGQTGNGQSSYAPYWFGF